MYDFTYFGPKDEEIPVVDKFVEALRPVFKKWVFQLEACPTTGTFHYQGRGSLHKKQRHGELCQLLNRGLLRGMDVSESSNSSKKLECFYALKEFSRVDGPWDDRSFKPPPYIPAQYRGLIETLRPWQQQVADSLHVQNYRNINVICDTRGNMGKTVIANLMRLHHGAIVLPPLGDHKELLQATCDILMAKKCRTPGMIFLDVPRSVDQKKMGPYMIAIEQILSGYVCDTRYSFKEWDFDTPQIWIFMNHQLDLSYLSADRWKFWQFNRLTDKLERLLPCYA